MDCRVISASKRVFRRAMPGNDECELDAAQQLLPPAEALTSRPGAPAAAGVEIDRTIRDRQAEGRADGAFDQADFAAVGAHELGHDGEPEPDAACAGRTLEGFE